MLKELNSINENRKKSNILGAGGGKSNNAYDAQAHLRFQLEMFIEILNFIENFK